MKKFVTHLLFPIMGVIMMTACGSTDNPWEGGGGVTNITELTYNADKLRMGYGSVNDPDNGILTQTTAPQLDILWDKINNTASFTFSPLVLSNGGYTTISTDTLKLTISDGQLVINPTTVKSGNQVLESFSFIGEGDWMSIKFILNGYKYVINTTYTFYNTSLKEYGVLWEGNTEIVTTLNPPTFTTDKIEYFVQFNDSAAILFMPNAKFHANMPELPMVFKDIPYSMTDDEYVLSIDSLIPSIKMGAGETAYPQYIITDFVANLPYNARNGNLFFLCTDDQWSVEATDMRMTQFNQILF